MSKQRFTGKVVLVTGGSSGIGRATALAFAREGAAVVIASRGAKRGQVVRRKLEAHSKAEFVPTDVSRADEVKMLMKRVVDRFGRLDCAFSNAGTVTIGVHKQTAEFSEKEFDRHIAFNLKSVWLCMKEEIAQMLRQATGGAIVNTSSITGLGGYNDYALYAAAKAGVLGLTKSAALEYAKKEKGIRVNAVVPGSVRTPMLESEFKRYSPKNPSAAEAEYERLVPLGRIGRPEEVALAVLWLCSDEAAYVTRHSLIVDGGETAQFR